MFQSLFDVPFAPFFAFDRLFSSFANSLRVSEKLFCAVHMFVPHNVLAQLKEFFVYVIIHWKIPGIDNSHIHASCTRFTKPVSKFVVLQALHCPVRISNFNWSSIMNCDELCRVLKGFVKRRKCNLRVYSLSAIITCSECRLTFPAKGRTWRTPLKTSRLNYEIKMRKKRNHSRSITLR